MASQKETMKNITMVRSHAYSAYPGSLTQDYEEIVKGYHRAGIQRLGILVASTGKLLCTPETMRALKEKLAADNIEAFALVYGIGHPMGKSFYTNENGLPEGEIFYDGPFIMTEANNYLFALTRGWRHQVNDNGMAIHSAACPDAACIEGNQKIIRVVAQVFDEVWYDDEARMDGDQGAGTQYSTAACYCDACLADLGKRLGRTVTRDDVLNDQAIHDAWVDQKTDKMAAWWQHICVAGREANPDLRLGLMVRWGGEERDGIDMDKLLPHFGGRVNLRAGEGHFCNSEYKLPECQVIEHLAASGHVSWFPQSVKVLTETTFSPDVNFIKKVALGLAAGASEPAYYPGVPPSDAWRKLVATDLTPVHRWADVFADKTAAHGAIHILRSPAAGRGNCAPVKRIQDRRPFPLFGLAGLYSMVVRQGHWRDTGKEKVLAVTGRSVWDFELDELGQRTLVLDGHALLERSPLNDAIGIRNVQKADAGRVTFEADGFKANGCLLVRDQIILVPYTWQDIPAADLESVLHHIRRVIGSELESVVVEGDTHVLPVHYRYQEHDAIMLANLTTERRCISLRLPDERVQLKDLDDQPLDSSLTLAPEEIRVVLARAIP